MSTWVGPLGGLVQVRTSSGITPHIERSVNLRTTLGGVQKAQLGLRTTRTRAHTLSVTKPEDVASFEALIAGEYGVGPFHWIDPWAQVSNLLTPAAAVLDTGTWYASTAAAFGGPVALADGGRAGRSLTVDSAGIAYWPADGTKFTPMPCVPGVPVTATAYVSGTGVTVAIHWVQADGTAISTVTSAAVTVPGPTLQQIAITGTPPASAAGMYMTVAGADVITRPAITWTDQPMPWRAGQGLPKVIVTALDSEVQLAHKNAGALATYTFTVTEVG